MSLSKLLFFEMQSSEFLYFPTSFRLDPQSGIKSDGSSRIVVGSENLSINMDQVELLWGSKIHKYVETIDQ